MVNKATNTTDLAMRIVSAKSLFKKIDCSAIIGMSAPGCIAPMDDMTIINLANQAISDYK